MGTDIHLYIEVKTNPGTDISPWELVFPKEIEPWRTKIGSPGCYHCYGTGKPKYPDESPPGPDGSCDDCGGKGIDAQGWYSQRNYDVFAILADVRNGRGFAGCDTGDGFEVIAKPRGLPRDLSPHLQRIMDRGIEHTPSWLSLREILDFDWYGKKTKHRGIVTAAEYRRMKESGTNKPHSWCGGVSGHGIRVVSINEMKKEILISENLQGLYTTVEWEETYAESAVSFLEFLPHLASLGEPEDIRLIFYFDS